jgi:hypothetical protein
MRFPIDGKQAEIAAKDLAHDARILGEEVQHLDMAIYYGDANENDKKNYKMLCDQIRSFAETEFYCVDTGEVYRVADYMTKSRAYISERKRRKLNDFYHKLIEFFTLK